MLRPLTPSVLRTQKGSGESPRSLLLPWTLETESPFPEKIKGVVQFVYLSLASIQKWTVLHPWFTTEGSFVPSYRYHETSHRFRPRWYLPSPNFLLLGLLPSGPLADTVHGIGVTVQDPVKVLVTPILLSDPHLWYSRPLYFPQSPVSPPGSFSSPISTAVSGVEHTSRTPVKTF